MRAAVKLAFWLLLPVVALMAGFAIGLFATIHHGIEVGR